MGVNDIFEIPAGTLKNVKTETSVSFPSLTELMVKKQAARAAGDFQAEVDIGNEIQAATKLMGETLVDVCWVETDRGRNIPNISSNAQEVRQAMIRAGVNTGWVTVRADGRAEPGCEEFLSTVRDLRRIAKYPLNTEGVDTPFTRNQNAFTEESNEQAGLMLSMGFLYGTSGVDFTQKPDFNAGVGPTIVEYYKYAIKTFGGLVQYGQGGIPEIDKVRWGRK